MKKPIHPMLVHFPIALLIASFLADAVHFFASWSSIEHVGWWMLALASAGGLFTVLAGLFDMRRATLDEAIHERVHQHMWVGMGLFLVICALTAWRWIFFSNATPVSMLYLDASFLSVGLATFQGWLGGELVYTHGVFVASQQKKAASRPAGKVAEANPHKHSH